MISDEEISEIIENNNDMDIIINTILDLLENNDNEKIKNLIQNKLRNHPNINELIEWSDSDGKTLAHYAAEYNCINLLEFIIENTSNDVLISKDDNGDLPLHLAVQKGNSLTVKFILSRDKKCINEKNDNGLSALHFSVINKKLDILEDLIECQELDVNDITGEDEIRVDRYLKLPPLMTAVAIATFMNYPQALKIILKRTDVVLNDKFEAEGLLDGEESESISESYDEVSNDYFDDQTEDNQEWWVTALHYAVYKDYYEIMKLLLNYESNHRESHPIYGSLDYRRKSVLNLLVLKDYFDLVEIIIERYYRYYSNVKLPGRAISPIESDVLYFIRKQINSRYNGFDERTLLHLSCLSRFYGLVEKLVLFNEYLHINYTDLYEKTAYFYAAVDLKDIRLVQILQKHANLDVNVKIEESSERKMRRGYKRILREEHDIDGDNLEELVDFCVKNTEEGDVDYSEEEDEGETPLTAFLRQNLYFSSKPTKPMQVDSSSIESIVILPLRLIEMLNHKSLNLDETGSNDLRAVSVAKKTLFKNLNRDQRKNIILLENDIIANLRRRNQKSLEEVLAKYTNEDLHVLLALSKHKIQETSILEGYINFNVHQDVRRTKKKLSPITQKMFIQIVQKIIAINDRKPLIKDNILNKQVVLNYIILRAAHSILSHTNYTSGEELDEETELVRAKIRQKQWHIAAMKSSQQTIISQNKELTFIPIFRGINFMRNHFEPEERALLEQSSYQRKFFASHACFTLINKTPHDPTVPEQELLKQSDYIKRCIVGLSTPDTCQLFKGSEKALRGCESFLRRLQIIYTENIDGFNYDIFANLKYAKPEVKERILKKYSWFEKVFKDNPFVSGSIIPWHSIRYVFGVSRANANTELLLDPHYNEMGLPKYSCIGLVYIALYPKAEYIKLFEQSHAIYVPKAYAQGYFDIKSPKTLLAEAEVTISGMMENVKLCMPIIYPSFSDDKKNEVMKKYSLSKAHYERIAKGLKSKRHSLAYKVALSSLQRCLLKYYNEKILEVTQIQASNLGGKLEYEMPNGHFTTVAPKPAVIRDMAIGLNKLSKNNKSQKPQTIDKKKDKNSVVSVKPCAVDYVKRTVSHQIPGLIYQKIPGDGHCLFHAVGVHVSQDQASLRLFVADHLKQNLNQFRAFIHLPNGQTIENYIRAIREGEEWADHIEIEILMRIFNRPIIVIGPDLIIKNQEVLEKGLKGEPIFVLYNGHNHYDAFLRTEGSSVQNILDFLQQQNKSYFADQSKSIQLNSKTSDAKLLARIGTFEAKQSPAKKSKSDAHVTLNPDISKNNITPK